MTVPLVWLPVAMATMPAAAAAAESLEDPPGVRGIMRVGGFIGRIDRDLGGHRLAQHDRTGLALLSGE